MVWASEAAGPARSASPSRVLVGGTSGSGKTTLARRLAVIFAIPQVELDGLHHGPNWQPRAEFADDVAALAASARWVTEYQYAAVRGLLLDRCELLVYLQLTRRVVMWRVVRRTVWRRIRRERLWHGNVEPPLRTIFTQRDHIVRWAWRTHTRNTARLAEIQTRRPEVAVVVLCSPRQVRRWLASLDPAR